jgi:hypothetical protein
LRELDWGVSQSDRLGDVKPIEHKHEHGSEHGGGSEHEHGREYVHGREYE